MIIEPTSRQVNGVNVYEILYQQGVYFYACGYVQGTKNIVLMTTLNIDREHEGKIQSVSSFLDCFGATDWAEFLDEISNRELIITS